MAKGKPKKRGAKGGVKHQPGRDHDRKSAVQRKKRFAKKAADKRKRVEENAKIAWDEWDRLPDDVKRLLGPAGRPNLPRPTDDQHSYEEE